MKRRTVILITAITWRVTIASVLIAAVYWIAKLDLPYFLAAALDILAILLGIVALRFPIVPAERRVLDEHSD